MTADAAPNPATDGPSPGRDEPATIATPSVKRLLWRACTKRCPVCGSGGLFRHWFTLRERCPRCGLKFERIEGHWTGDLGINTVVSFGALLVTLLAGFALTYPDVPGGALFAVAMAVALFTPLAFYPFSKTIWLAIDLAMRPLEPGEVPHPERVP